MLHGFDLGLERFALGVECGAVAGNLGALPGEKREEFGELVEGGAGRLLRGRRGECAFDADERLLLLVEEFAGVVEAARLFFEAAELVFEGFDAVVGREVEEGGARGDVEEGDLRGAAAGDLERLLDECGGEVVEHELLLAGGGDVECGGARDDRAVGVNGDG